MQNAHLWLALFQKKPRLSKLKRQVLIWKDFLTVLYQIAMTTNLKWRNICLVSELLWHLILRET